MTTTTTATKRKQSSPYLPQNSDWFQRKQGTTLPGSAQKPIPHDTSPLTQLARKTVDTIVSLDKAETLRNNSRIISRKLKEFEKVLEKSYSRDQFDKKEPQLLPCDNAITNNPAALSRRCPKPKDRSFIYDIHSTLPDYDAAFNPLKNPDPLSTNLPGGGSHQQDWSFKKAAKRIIRAYNPLIVPLPQIPRESTVYATLPTTRRSHPGYVPLSPARYLTHRKPRAALGEEVKARPRLQTRRRVRTPPEPERPKSRENFRPENYNPIKSSLAITLTEPSVKSSCIATSESTKYPHTGTSPSDVALSGRLAPPSTTAASSENLASSVPIQDSNSAHEEAGGGDTEPPASEHNCPSSDAENKSDASVKKSRRKSDKRKRNRVKSDCGSVTESEKSFQVSESSKDSSAVTKTSAPLKGILKKAGSSSSHVSISLLTKIGVCTAQPGTREWDKYWEKYDRAIAQFKRSEALFLKDSKEYQEDLEKFRKEAARMAMEDAIFRQSIGLEPRQVQEVMGQPLMGLTTLNGFVFDRNYGPHRPQAFLTSVGSKGVRMELDLRGYEPDDVKIETEFNLMKVNIPPDDPKDPLKTIVIGMASDYSVSDMEIYPIVEGWLVIEAPDKKHAAST